MAMRLNENLDDNGECRDQRDAVYRRHAVLLIISWWWRAAGDGRPKVNLPASSQPQPRPENPIYLSVKADKSMFLHNDPGHRSEYD